MTGHVLTGSGLTGNVSADTDDLDAFVEHGQGLQRWLVGTHETLARQRNYLLSAGFPQVVENPRIPTLENTRLRMADLDQFVEDISTALKRWGEDVGQGVFQAPASRIAARLDGATVAEPGDLAEAPVQSVRDLANDLVENNQVNSNSLHGRSRLSIYRLAGDLHYGNNTIGLVPQDLLMAELGSILTDDQNLDLREELELLWQREQNANASLLGHSLLEHSPAEFDTDLGTLRTQALELYDNNKVGEPYGGAGHRLNETEIAYQLQKLAAEDPGAALGLKWMLESIMTPYERAELDRVLGGNSSFSERADRAIAHPVDGNIGGAKRTWNESWGWWADEWADAQVAITYGFYGMATGSNPTLSPEVREALPQGPQTWEEIDQIVELELEMDNIAQQGGGDIAFAIEIASGVYGVGKGGLTLVKVGRRYFLRSGDNVVAEASPVLARHLDEVAPTVIRERDIRRVLAPGRIDHVLHGEVNRASFGSGGHYLRSPSVRLIEVLGADANGVVEARIAVRGPGGRWVPKRAASTFFPPHMTARQIELEIDHAFKNSHAVFDPASLAVTPKRWSGKTSDGLTIEGYYKVNGDPTRGWSAAFPIFEGP